MLARNTRPELMFDWCVSQQRVSNCIVAEHLVINKAILQTKRHHHVRLRFVGIGAGEEIVVVFTDAAFANVAAREDPIPLNSQGGSIIGIATKNSLSSGNGLSSLIYLQSTS